MKYIFFLLFVYFLFIRPAIKRAKSRGEAQPAPRQPPLNLLLQRVREQLRQAADSAKQGSAEGEGARGTSSLADLLAKLKEPAPTADPFPQPEHVTDSFETEEEEWLSSDPGEVSPDPTSEPIAVSLPSRPQEVGGTDALPEKGAAAPDQALRGRTGYRGMNLRAAVVWSEILRPPVGLHDRDEE